MWLLCTDLHSVGAGAVAGMHDLQSVGAYALMD